MEEKARRTESFAGAFLMVAAGLFKLFDYIASNRWAQIVLLVLAVILTAGFYLALRDNGVRKREREKIAARQAEVRVAVNERVDEIATEERSNADDALEARDDGEHFPTADVVPIELQTIGFRNPRGS